MRTDSICKVPGTSEVLSEGQFLAPTRAKTAERVWLGHRRQGWSP